MAQSNLDTLPEVLLLGNLLPYASGMDADAIGDQYMTLLHHLRAGRALVSIPTHYGHLAMRHFTDTMPFDPELSTYQSIRQKVHRRFQAVVITDEALVKHEDLWEAVLGYVQEGGTAVVLGKCAFAADRDEVGAFFAKAGLSWKVGNINELGIFYAHTATVGDPELLEQALAAQLPTTYLHQYSMTVHNVPKNQILYFPSFPLSMTPPFLPLSDETRLLGLASAALARVGEGKLGYLGDLNSNSDMTTKIVLAMCGLKIEV